MGRPRKPIEQVDPASLKHNSGRYAKRFEKKEEKRPTEFAPPAFSHAAKANQYARDVGAGRIDACKWIKLACKRHLDDIAASKQADARYVFDESAANRACRFIEQLPHIEGRWVKKAELLTLSDWQVFIVCALFGWKHRESGFRRFRIAYVCVPRKNGKSTFAAAIGLYMLYADDEFGAQVFCGAGTEKQAWKVFNPARIMAKKSAAILDGVTVGAKSLFMPENGSKFVPLIGQPGDGDSPSCYIIDEYHEHDTDALFDAMQTGTGARDQPLGLVITTAGTNIGGPCYLFQREVEKVLEGSIERDELFGVIYTLDEGDDWTSLAALRKANPNFGISVGGDYLELQVKTAISDKRKQSITQTKHLNEWVNASSGWMNMHAWRQCADPSLKRDEFKGLPAFVALDLSSVNDLASRAIVFRKMAGKDAHYYLFTDCYAPKDRVMKPENQHYQGWEKSGLIATSAGARLDYEQIQKDTEAIIKEFHVKEAAFDPWNAEQMGQNLEKNTRAKAVEVPQKARFLSEPMKQFEALVDDGKIHHDGNPVLTWAISNVVVKPNQAGEIIPMKERDESKIDPAVAGLMAVSRALVAKTVASVYETRGVLSI